MRFLIIALIGIAGSSGLANAQEARPAAKMSTLFDGLGDFLAIPNSDRSHLEMDYVVSADDPALNDFGLWIEPDGKRIDLPRDELGRIDVSEIAPYLDADPMVMTTLPKGGGAINAEPTPKLDLSGPVPVADINTSIEQVNLVIRKKAGPLSMVAPKMKGVIFFVSSETTGVVQKTDGSEQVLAVENDRITFRPGETTGAARLVFSQPPIKDIFTD